MLCHKITTPLAFARRKITRDPWHLPNLNMSSLLLILWLTWKKPTPTELKFYQKDGNIGQKLSLGRSKTRGSLYIKHVWTIFPYDQAKQSAFKKDKSDQQHSKWPATLALVSNLNDPCWTHKACLRTPRCPSMKPFAVGDGCVKKMSREPREKKTLLLAIILVG